MSVVAFSHSSIWRFLALLLVTFLVFGSALAQDDDGIPELSDEGLEVEQEIVLCAYVSEPPVITHLFIGPEKTDEYCDAKAGNCKQFAKWLPISVEASDLEGEVLTYSFEVSEGQIVGDGRKVTWDLSGSSLGKHTITICVDDGVGCVDRKETFTIELVESAAEIGDTNARTLLPKPIQNEEWPAKTITDPDLDFPIEIIGFTADKYAVKYCENECGWSSVVNLEVQINKPITEDIEIDFDSEEGTIRTKGNTAKIYLGELEPGTYEVEVTVYRDGDFVPKKVKKTISLTVVP